MQVFQTIDAVRAAAGTLLGASEWLEITQERVDAFAEATGDRQWIHVDVDRAAAGPFGSTIAHGYLTLALLPYLSSQVVSLRTPGPRINYGLNKVRFPTPVRVGARIRVTVSFGAVTQLTHGVQVVQHSTIEIDGVDKSACVAESLVLLLDE